MNLQSDEGTTTDYTVDGQSTPVPRITTDLVLVIGPSGAGKTLLLSTVRSDTVYKNRIITMDLDVIGYRTPQQQWRDWKIDQGIFSVMARVGRLSGCRVLLGGADSHPDVMVPAARAAGFTVVAVIPTPSELRRYRVIRGDSHDKINEAAKSVADWIEIAGRYRLDVFVNASDVLATIGG